MKSVSPTTWRNWPSARRRSRSSPPSGRMTQPGDYEDLLAGLEYCLENRERLGRNARKVVRDRYQWADVVKAYADLYERVLTEWRGAGRGGGGGVVRGGEEER